MARVWTASYVFCLFLCVARSQQIYLNSHNDCVLNERTMLILKDQINFLRQENARKINSLRQENARHIDSLMQENVRIKEDFDVMLSILKKNISDFKEDLKSILLKIIENGLNLKKDCNDLYINGITKSGVYEINPSGVYKIKPSGIESKLSVFCDMMVEGGGWTTIQKRVSGSVRFNRTWAEYTTGFGNSRDSYWIGNDVIHQITKGRNSSLYVSITLTNGKKLFELYNQFSVADEMNKHRLFLGGQATGTLGDMMLNSLASYSDVSGMNFSTPDKDNDRYNGFSCAAHYQGGWWFNKCHNAYLNGPWNSSDWVNPWFPVVISGTSVKETMMMIKPH